MKVLQYDHILKMLELPTIDWNEFFQGTSLTKDMLWTIKVEAYILGEKALESEAKKKSLLHFLKDRRCLKAKKESSLIGADADRAMAFGERMRKQIKPNIQTLIYYPYYTVVKSGILDLNRERLVIEGTKGDISNMVHHNHIDVTMEMDCEDVKIQGDEHFFEQEQVLALIDHGRRVRKMTAKDLEEGKNIQLYFSFVYHTSDALKPLGEQQLIFYQYKSF